MNVIASVLIGLVALIHAYIAVFEMFLWERRGPRIFRSFPDDLFPKTTALAFNMGAYNAILAAGLVWSLSLGEGPFQRSVATFFLLAVVFAGAVGAVTAEKRIVFVQCVPAAVALVPLWL